MSNKNVYIIAGPNGSGKTTFATKFLPGYAQCPNFINADLIAQGLSPFSPRQGAMKAGKLVLQQIKEFTKKNVDFGFETTLAGKTYLRHFRELRQKGYKLHIFLLWIPDFHLAIERIKDRVAEGGHDVPAEDVKRRFERGIENFFKNYRLLADKWILFNNATTKPEIIAKKQNAHIDIIDQELYTKIVKKVGVEL